nr:MAG TPA: hypothetical protein [Caudoviricetes sp.]
MQFLWYIGSANAAFITLYNYIISALSLICRTYVYHMSL